VSNTTLITRLTTAEVPPGPVQETEKVVSAVKDGVVNEPEIALPPPAQPAEPFAVVQLVALDDSHPMVAVLPETTEVEEAEMVAVAGIKTALVVTDRARDLVDSFPATSTAETV